MQEARQGKAAGIWGWRTGGGCWIRRVEEGGENKRGPRHMKKKKRSEVISLQDKGREGRRDKER